MPDAHSPTPAPAPASAPRPLDLALLASVFVIAACGLLYELAAGALASYVLGDSVLQFSTVIGTYLFAMGVGSWLSRYIENHLAAHFLRIELLVALVGGLLPAVLFLANVYLAGAFRPLLYGMVWLVGAMVDITPIQQAQTRLKAANDLLQMAQRAGGIGAFEIDVPARRNHWTPELEHIYGLAPGGYDGTVDHWGRLLHPDDREPARLRAAAALAGC